MSVGYINTHKIIKRQSLKLKVLDPHTLPFVRERMEQCYASIKNTKEGWFVVDVEMGPIAEVLDILNHSGSWHSFEIVQYVKARFEVDDFYKPEVQKKYKRPKKMVEHQD